MTDEQAKCKHEWQVIREPSHNSSGYHEDKCIKCGYINSYDTSD